MLGVLDEDSRLDSPKANSENVSKFITSYHLAHLFVYVAGKFSPITHNDVKE